MRYAALIVLTLGACAGNGPRHALESGSYVPVEGETTHGLDGVNLNRNNDFANFVVGDQVIARDIALLDEKSWLVGCKEERKDGILEVTAQVEGEPVELEDGVVLDDIVIAASCEEAGVIRVVGDELTIELEAL